MSGRPVISGPAASGPVISGPATSGPDVGGPALGDPAFVARRYKREHGHSYAFGAAPTIELLRRRPDLAIKVYVRHSYAARDPSCDIRGLCAELGVPCEAGDKAFNRVGAKESEHVLGAFRKPAEGLDEGARHVALVNPADAGNLGTILRTGAGFGFMDFVVVCPGVDVFDPKAVRASMGAVFHCRYLYVDSFEQYMRGRAGRPIIAFMLDGRNSLEQAARSVAEPAAEQNAAAQNVATQNAPADGAEAPAEVRGLDGASTNATASGSVGAYTLVFGNEATGLPERFLDYGMSVVIPHKPLIDSLSLPVAFGIAAHALSRPNVM